MTPKTTVLSDNVTHLIELYNNLPLPIAKQKFKEDYYKENLYKKTIFENDDKICLTETKFTILYNTKFFPKQSTNQGLTYDKKTRKVKVWFGTKLINLPLFNLFRYLGITWLDKMNGYENYNDVRVIDLIKTKSIVEKIISGKITNPKELIRQYIKTSIKYKYDWRIVCDFLKHNNNNNNNNSLTTFLITISKFTVNPNESLKVLSHLKKYDKKLSDIVHNHGQITDGFWDGFPIERLKEIHDVSRALNNLRRHKNNLMSLLLNASFIETKVNFKWSPKRVEHESKRINNILLDYQGLTKNETERQFIGDVTLPDNYRMIKSESDLFKSLRIADKYILNDSIAYCHLWSNNNYYFINTSLPFNMICVIRQNKHNGHVSIETIIGTDCDESRRVIRAIICEWLSTQEAKTFFESNHVIREDVITEADMMDLF